MLTISSGHSASYLTGAVATGRENYYTGAVAAGEPPGRWSGRGAERLGLAGEVDTQDMTALYERFMDPRDERFKDPVKWDEADTLGHTGRKYLTEDEIYATALAAESGADAERRAALRVEAGKKARKNVAFLDATFSVQKSITVLHTAFEAQEVRARCAAERARAALAPLTGAPASAAGAGSTPGSPSAPSAGASAPGTVRAREIARLTAKIEDAEVEAASWADYRRAVEDAIWAGNQAALEYLSGKAGYSRVGHHGGAAGRWVDAHDWTVASFFQHDSRDRDPQLHIHNAVLNRVEGSDGQWRTLDAQAMYRFRGAASAVGDRVMEQHLSRSLGVRLAARPDGKAREILGIDQAVMELFSSRRRAITRKTQTLVRAFETRFGRSPNSLELDRRQRQATFASRRAKSHDGESVEQRLERWDAQLRAEVAGGLRQVADDVLARVGERSRGERWKTREVIEEALAEVQETKAAWTAPDLTRAISNALPDDLGTLDPEKVARLLDRLTAKALKLAVPLDAKRPGDKHVPDELRLADGGSAYEARGGRLYATPAHIHTERLLKAASTERTAPALSDRAVTRLLDGFAETGIELGADQAAAVRGILTSGASVETLVGPAGTGKSFVVGALAKAWQDPALWGGPTRPATGRRVVGLAASQVATDVLAGEGLTARNIARWLDTQERLLEAAKDGRRPSKADRPWALRAGDLVVVDESAMANTADLAQIHTVCKAAKAKLLLVGDHRQLAAVGAGGAMDLMTSAALDGAVTHELAETRRFRQTWEGPASLRLRDRDETVLAEYHKHGRLLDCGPVEQAEASAARAWLADTLDDQTSILVVDTNEQAARLSAQLRADLVRLGRVDDERRVPLGLQGTFAGVGDLVQSRRNEWKLAGYHGNRRGPINREIYRVVGILDDGDLRVVTRDGETMTLPAGYVAEHLALGYASTVHAAQGMTVDTAHTVATGATGADALYVGLTRGRHSNIAHVVTESIPADAPVGTTKQALHRSPQSVLAGAFETTDSQLSALAEATQSAAEVDTVRTPAELLADAAQIATAGRTARWLDELVTEGRLSPAQRTELAAEDGATTLTTVLRRAELAGHDPRRVLTDAIDRRSLDNARQITNVLHRRITETTTLDPIGDSYADWVPQVDDPQWRAYLTTLATAADDRRTELGELVAAKQPQWAIEALGPLPARRGKERSDWLESAAAVAAHREFVGHDGDDDALGPAPKPGQVEAYASWRAAWRALGRPEADRAEAEMSVGQLRLRIRAYEREATWAPRYVANELAGTRQAADKHRRDAAVRRAEAEVRDAEHEAAVDKAADMEWRAQRLLEAEQAEALAAALDTRAAELAEADEARAQWYAHTAETRAAADRARAELTARQAAGDLGPDEPAVTAGEWLAATDVEARAEDPHRAITAEHEVADLEAQRDNDHRDARTDNDADPDGTIDSVRVAGGRGREQGVGAIDIHQSGAAIVEPEPAPVDIRQQAERGPEHDRRPDAAEANAEAGADTTAAASPVSDDDRRSRRSADQDEDTVRVPSSDETAESVRRAQRALAELRQREVIEARRAHDEARDAELARWHTDDTSGAGSGDSAANTGAAGHAANTSEPTSRANEPDGAGPVLDRAR